MPDDTKDLMSAVGESFGIQDQQPQQQDGSGEGGDGQSAPQDQQQGGDFGAEIGGQQQPQRTDDGQQPPAQPPTQQTRKDDQLFPDKPRRGPRGELLDAKGNTIAATRREKQLAFNLNRAQYAANAANRTSRQLQAQLAHFQQLDATIKENNLSPQMVREAIELRALAEKDPILAVRDVVARVLASGVTMEQLFGNDAVPSINARVITNELDRRLGPMEQQHRAQQRTQQINERAQEQMEAFVANHPHADTHGIAISNLVSQHGMTPEKAYYELRSWAERRGLDFTQPLGAQVEAMQKRGGGQQQRGRTTPGGGRGAQPNGQFTTQSTTTQRGDFKSNTPWRDIASAVFTELNSK